MGFFYKGKPHTVHVQGHSSNQKGLLELSNSDELKKILYTELFLPHVVFSLSHMQTTVLKHIIFHPDTILLCSSTIRRKIHPVLNLTTDKEGKNKTRVDISLNTVLSNHCKHWANHCTLLYWVNSLYHFTLRHFILPLMHWVNELYFIKLGQV